MKKLIFILALTFSTSVFFTSCREESGVERAADDAGDAIEEAGEEVD